MNQHQCLLRIETTGLILLFSKLELESSHLYPVFCVSNTHMHSNTSAGMVWILLFTLNYKYEMRPPNVRQCCMCVCVSFRFPLTAVILSSYQPGLSGRPKEMTYHLLLDLTKLD